MPKPKRKPNPLLGTQVRVCGKKVDPTYNLVCLLPFEGEHTRDRPHQRHTAIAINYDGEVFVVYRDQQDKEGKPVWLLIEEAQGDLTE